MADKRTWLLMIFVTFYQYKSVLPSLCEDEFRIVVDVIKKMDIRHCILFRETHENNNIFKIKKFSSMNIGTTVINGTDQLINHIRYKDKYLSYSKTMVIVDDKDSLISQEIVSITEYEWFTTRLEVVVWLVFSEKLITYPISDRDVVNFNNEFINIQNINTTTYELTEVYALKNKTFFNHFGLWDQGWVNVDDSPFYLRRSNLNGTELTTFVPQLCMDKTKHDPRTCNVMELLSDISRVMNFEIIQTMATVDDVLDEFLFSWNDILGGGYPWLGASEIDLMTILGPLYKTKFNWYIKQPDGKLKADYFLKPFRMDFWLVVIFSVVINTVFIIIIKIFLKNLTESKEKNIITNNLFIGIEIFCNQSGSQDLKNTSFRIANISLRIIAIFSLVSYGAVVNSFLVSKFDEVPFSNLKEFLEQKHYRLVSDSVLLEHMQIYYYHETDKKLLRHNFSLQINFNNLTDFQLHQYLERVCKEKLAIAFFDNDVYSLNPPCDLHKIKEPLSESSIFLILSLSTPFTRIFMEKLIKFYESGILKRMETKVKEVHVRAHKQVNFFSVEIEQVVRMLSMPLIGVIIALLFFSLELFIKKRSADTTHPVLHMS